MELWLVLTSSAGNLKPIGTTHEKMSCMRCGALVLHDQKQPTSWHAAAVATDEVQWQFAAVLGSVQS